MGESNPIILYLVFSSLAENQSLKSDTKCKDLFKPRKGQPTCGADNQANCLGGAISFQQRNFALQRYVRPSLI